MGGDVVTLPHAAYADAVHKILASAGMPPGVMNAAVIETVAPITGGEVRDLTISLHWASGHSATWSHVRGWVLHRPDWGCVQLSLPVLVDPAVLVAPIRAALAGRSGSDLPDKPVLWADHLALDKLIADWEATRA